MARLPDPITSTGPIYGEHASTNLIGDATGITDFTVSASSLVGSFGSEVSPSLDALADNGGLTLTHLPGTGSLAINAGSDPLTLATDQRGATRNQGSQTDIGSVETVPPLPDDSTVTVMNLNDSGADSLREAMTSAQGASNITINSFFFMGSSVA